MEQGVCAAGGSMNKIYEDISPVYMIYDHMCDRTYHALSLKAGWILSVIYSSISAL